MVCNYLIDELLHQATTIAVRQTDVGVLQRGSRDTLAACGHSVAWPHLSLAGNLADRIQAVTCG